MLHEPGRGVQAMFATNTWRRSLLRVEANAIRAPSGDQVGSVSSPGLAVRLAIPVPSEFMAQTSRPSLLPYESVPPAATNNNRCPSGDHRGCALSPGPKVSWRDPLPSGSIHQICSVRPSSRSLTNAIPPPPPSRPAGSAVGGGASVSVGAAVGVASGAADGVGGWAPVTVGMTAATGAVAVGE